MMMMVVVMMIPRRFFQVLRDAAGFFPWRLLGFLNDELMAVYIHEDDDSDRYRDTNYAVISCFFSLVD